VNETWLNRISSLSKGEERRKKVVEMEKLQSFKGGHFYETEDPASSRAAGQSES